MYFFEHIQIGAFSIQLPVGLTKLLSFQLVEDFLCDIAAFRGLLLDAFLAPLIDAFVLLPTEIVLKIWDLSQPHFSLTPQFMDSVETRKFFILVKTTTLAIYNAATQGKKLDIQIYLMHSELGSRRSPKKC